MSIDMSEFVEMSLIQPLTWLGRHEWLNFEQLNGQWLLQTNKSILQKIDIHDKRYTKSHWDNIKLLVDSSYGDKELLFTYVMSRTLAFGPKMFKPNLLQCKAFENTTVDIPFEYYAQPYESLLIQFPEDYRQLKLEEGWNKCPLYVICWYDKQRKLIMVTSQFDNKKDKIGGVLSLNETQTLESLLTNTVYREAGGVAAEQTEDFQIAQNFERIAINLNLLMMYGNKKHIITPLDKTAQEKQKILKEKYNKLQNKKSLEQLNVTRLASIGEIKFLEQNVGFTVSVNPAIASKGTVLNEVRASPKPHWRKGHWVNQPYGPNASLRKPVLRPSVFVVGQDYKDLKINLATTQVSYKQTKSYYNPESGKVEK